MVLLEPDMIREQWSPCRGAVRRGRELRDPGTCSTAPCEPVHVMGCVPVADPFEDLSVRVFPPVKRPSQETDPVFGIEQTVGVNVVNDNGDLGKRVIGFRHGRELAARSGEHGQ